MLRGGKFFAAATPKDWPQVLGFLADAFGFQPSELWAMDASDMEFWMERYKEASKRRKRHPQPSQPRGR